MTHFDESNPYGEMFHNEELEDDVINDNEDCEDCDKELNQREGISVSDILEDRENIKKYVNLVAIGITGVLALIVLKRFI
jgi:hypothetical protein